MKAALTFVPILLVLTTPVLCFSSHSWMVMWLSMEMSTLGFLILMSMEKKKEKTFIFFVFQSMSSITTMVFMFYCYWMNTQNEMSTIVFFLVVAMMIKMGMFPFQSWMVGVSKSMSWLNLSILLTWQKMIPVILLTKSMKKTAVKTAFLISTLALSVMMLKMANLKTMTLMSSLAHSGWIFIPMKIMKMASTMYLTVYSMVLLMANYHFKKWNSSCISNQTSEEKSKMEVMMIMFTLAGTPPTLGFLLKMMVVSLMIKENMEKWGILMFLASTPMSFFVYFQMFYKNISMVNMNSQKKVKTKKNKKEIWAWTLALSIIVLMA